MRKPVAGTYSNSYFRSSAARSQGIVDFASVTQVTALANRILDSPVLAVPLAAASIAFTMCKMQDRASRLGMVAKAGWVETLSRLADSYSYLAV